MKRSRISGTPDAHPFIIRQPLRLASVCFTLFALIFVSYWQGYSLAYDTAVIEQSVHWRADGLTRLFALITKAGEGIFLAPFAVLVIVTVFLLRYRLEALLLTVTIGGCEGISETLKDTIMRERPVGYNLIELPTSYSMPSGHALVGAVFFTLLTILLYQRYRVSAVRYWIAVVGFGFVLLLCISRVYLGVHYPTDVLAGYSLGMSWMLLVYAFYQRRLTRTLPNDQTKNESPSMPTL